MEIQSVIQTPTTHHAADTIQFYEGLGFENISAGDDYLFSDGKVLIGLNSERTARTAIRLFGNWEKEISDLSQSHTIHQKNDVALLSDPSGAFVQLEPEMSIEISGEPSSALGNFAGLSIETSEFGRTARFWESLGYSSSCGAEEQGWMTMEKERMVGISLMKTGVCPHLFFSPGLTYFNSGKNVENIKKIRDAGIDVTEEITCFNKEGIVDNIVLRDPGGTGFFIFND